MNVLLSLRELSTAGTWIWTHKGGKAMYVKYDQTLDFTSCPGSSCERGDTPPLWFMSKPEYLRGGWT